MMDPLDIFGKDNLHRRSHDRGVSVTIEYALTAVIVISLVATVSSVAYTSANDTQERVVQTELDRIAQEAATGVETADTLTQEAENSNSMALDSGASPTVSVAIDLPQAIGEIGYTIRVVGGSLVLEPNGGNPPVMTQVKIDTELPVTAQGGTSGGPIVVRYDSAADELVIESRN